MKRSWCTMISSTHSERQLEGLPGVFGTIGLYFQKSGAQTFASVPGNEPGDQRETFETSLWKVMRSISPENPSWGGDDAGVFTLQSVSIGARPCHSRSFLKLWWAIYLVLAQQRYAKSHRILANCRGVKDFRRFRNSQDGTRFSRSVLGA